MADRRIRLMMSQMFVLAIPWDLYISFAPPIRGLSVALEMASILFISLLFESLLVLPELWTVVDFTKLLTNLISGRLECFLRSNYSEVRVN